MDGGQKFKTVYRSMFIVYRLIKEEGLGRLFVILGKREEHDQL
jgi:hypothetical protein